MTPAPRVSLLDLCQATTGIEWDWYDCDKAALGTEGRWQLMPEPHDQAGGDFWEWYVTTRRQWYDQKSVAVTRLLCAWLEWNRGRP